MPDIILHLIDENTSTCIRVRQKLSPRISTTSGVKQGCILALILFCVAIDWKIQHKSLNPGITVGSSTFTDLVYVDDTALLLPSAMDAITLLKSFSDSASHLGLNIAWPKTKPQNIGSSPKPPHILVDGNTVESVDSFVNLGILQSPDGQCTPYRPRLCSHDVSKTDIARQAPDTQHQALYIPDTCFVCVDNALDDDTPANMALQLHINVSLYRPPDHTTHARVEAWCRLWTWWWCNDVTDARCSAELSDGLCDNTDIYSWRTVYRQSGSDGKGKKRQFCQSK